jgi:hypothetical protein
MDDCIGQHNMFALHEACHQQQTYVSPLSRQSSAVHWTELGLPLPSACLPVDPRCAHRHPNCTRLISAVTDSDHALVFDGDRPTLH